MGLLDVCVLRKKQRAAVLRRRGQAMVEDLDRIAFRGLPDATTADFAIVNLMYTFTPLSVRRLVCHSLMWTATKGRELNITSNPYSVGNIRR